MKAPLRTLAVSGLSFGLIAAPTAGAFAAAPAAQPNAPAITSLMSDGVNAPLDDRGDRTLGTILHGTATVEGTVAGTDDVDSVDLRDASGRTLCVDSGLRAGASSLSFACDIDVPFGSSRITPIAVTDGVETPGKILVLDNLDVEDETPGVGATPAIRVIRGLGGTALIKLLGGPNGTYTVTAQDGKPGVAPGQLGPNGEVDVAIASGKYTLTVDDTRQGGSVNSFDFTIREASTRLSTAGPVAPPVVVDPPAGAEYSAAIAQQFQGAALVEFKGPRLGYVLGEATNGQKLQYTGFGNTGVVQKQLSAGSWTFEFFDEKDDKLGEQSLEIATAPTFDPSGKPTAVVAGGPTPAEATRIPLYVRGQLINGASFVVSVNGTEKTVPVDFKGEAVEWFEGFKTGKNTVTVRQTLGGETTETQSYEIVVPKFETGTEPTADEPDVEDGADSTTLELHGQPAIDSHFVVNVNGTVQRVDAARDGTASAEIKGLKSGRNLIAFRQVLNDKTTPAAVLTIDLESDFDTKQIPTGEVVDSDAGKHTATILLHGQRIADSTFVVNVAGKVSRVPVGTDGNATVTVNTTGAATSVWFRQTADSRTTEAALLTVTEGAPLDTKLVPIGEVVSTDAGARTATIELRGQAVPGSEFVVNVGGTKISRVTVGDDGTATVTVTNVGTMPTSVWFRQTLGLETTGAALLSVQN